MMAAKLIVKSPYRKGGAGAGKYMNYIATREDVELLAEGASRPVTAKQKELIADVLKNLPETKSLFEYEDYLAAPTMQSASAFFSSAIENNRSRMQEENSIYLRYIATRPGVEKRGEHGLFGDADGMDLQKMIGEVQEYKGNVWMHIFSLKREDAARLGFDNAAAWQNLLRTHRNEIAAAMRIAPDDFRWCAAFHNAGDHPHVHMMAWSAKENRGYLNQQGIRQIKSTLTNDIFKQEMLHLYEEKSEVRDKLVEKVRESIWTLGDALEEGIYIDPALGQKLRALSEKVAQAKGKKQYGYLPKTTRNMVDEIVDELAKVPEVAACYECWWKLYEEVCSYYSDNLPEQLPLSQQKEFRSIRNAVVKEAVQLWKMEMLPEPGQVGHENAAMAVMRLLKEIENLFWDKEPQYQQQMKIDRKRLRELRRKKLAQGLRLDDGMQGMSM